MVATEKRKVLDTEMNDVCNIRRIVRGVLVELHEHKF